MSDNIIPRNNCIWKKTIHVSRRATSYFMKGIIIILSNIMLEFLCVRTRTLSSLWLVMVYYIPVVECRVFLPIRILLCEKH